MGASSLVDLATTYFRQRGYKIDTNVVLEGFSGLPHTFDLVIRKGREHHLVVIRDWKRTVGVNIIINIDKAAEDVGVPNPIMISEKFSSHAKAYANRRGITLLPKYQIERGLR